MMLKNLTLNQHTIEIQINFFYGDLYGIIIYYEALCVCKTTINNNVPTLIFEYIHKSKN